MYENYKSFTQMKYISLSKELPDFRTSLIFRFISSTSSYALQIYNFQALIFKLINAQSSSPRVLRFRFQFRRAKIGLRKKIPLDFFILELILLYYQTT